MKEVCLYILFIYVIMVISKENTREINTATEFQKGEKATYPSDLIMLPL